MSWAARRRFFILLIAGLVIVGVIAAILAASLYRAPSCSDGIQNQNETGIDCGGSCSYLCTAELNAPVVLSTRAIPNGSGRTDVLAYVENTNVSAAARAVPYTITLYDANHSLVQTVNGTLDLLPATTVPVYVSGVASGKQVVASAFLSIDAANVKWFSYKEARALPVYDNDATLSNALVAPRITATLSNVSALPIANAHAIVVVYDASGTSIAASATVVPMIPAQGRATIVFTWNQPFAGTPTSIAVVPVVRLP